MGVPTLIMGSALDILEAGKPPRVQFLDFPLGFETGPFQDQQTQLEVVSRGLAGCESFTTPVTNSLRFSLDAGCYPFIHVASKYRRYHELHPGNTEPQYQTEEDRLLAEQHI